MSPRAQRITGWTLTAIVSLFLLGGSAVPKFLEWNGKAEMMNKLGLPLELVPYIGVLEIAVALLFLIPRTAFLGAILLTGYLGGAVLTHLRVADVWFFPTIIGVVAWVALSLRRPIIFQLAFHPKPEQGA